jgi:hypothetical protein
MRNYLHVRRGIDDGGNSLAHQRKLVNTENTYLVLDHCLLLSHSESALGKSRPTFRKFFHKVEGGLDFLLIEYEDALDFVKFDAGGSSAGSLRAEVGALSSGRRRIICGGRI